MKIYVVALITLFSSTAVAQSADEEKQVLSVVQQFFDALKAKDTVAFRDLFLKEPVHFFITNKGDSVVAGMRTVLKHTFRNTGVVLERMRDKGVVVQIHERIATVWAPYDLWVDDKYSHCGVDAFTLVKTKKRWLISSVTYSIEREGCGTK